MAVQSIRAPIEKRDVAGDHLLVPPREVAFRKMDGVGKFNDLPEKIWPGPKALDDAGDLFSSRTGAPVIVCRGDIPGSFGVFRDPDLCCRLRVRFGGLGFVVHVHGRELYFLRNFRTTEHRIIGANCILAEGAVDRNSRQHDGHSQQGLARAVSRQQYKQ
jgi:hypothetical protein